MTVDITIRAGADPKLAARIAARFLKFIDSAMVQRMLESGSTVRVFEYTELGDLAQITRRP